MKDKTIKVLLSAYNGEKYIEEQIDSILAQTYQNIEVFVRDDGSTDTTCSLLEEYEKSGKIKLIKGKNVGFIASFFELFQLCGDADYYAFADQDDVWNTNKIEFAIEKLESKNQDIPLLYFSNYDYYSQELKYLGQGNTGEKRPSFHNSLVDCMPLGFNMVFNRKAYLTVIKSRPKHSCGHDWWMYMICSGLGQVIYDDRPTVKYRRHNSNVSAGGMSFWKFQVWRFKKFFLNNYFDNIRKQLQEYEDLYANSLSEDNRKLLSLFTAERFKLKKVIIKLCYPHRFRQSIGEEIMIRSLFLLGKL